MTPQTFDHFIGQQEVVARFKVALEAAWNDGTRLPHMLLCGPAGCGKTLLSHLAAMETVVQLHDRIRQVLNCMSVVNGLLAQAKDKEVIFIDEIHEMLPTSQTLLYRAMEDRTVFVTTRGRQTMSLSLADHSLLASTTDEFALLSHPQLSIGILVQLPSTHASAVQELPSSHAVSKAHSVGGGGQPHIAPRTSIEEKTTNEDN